MDAATHTPHEQVQSALAPEVSAVELASLLAAASHGEQTAWRRVIDLYGRRVFALAKSRLRRPDLAEEITQSVFVTVAGKLCPRPGVAGPGLDGTTGAYTEQGKFEAWLFRVAVNRIRDEVRKLRRHASPTDPEILATIPQPSGNTAGGNVVEHGTELARLRDAMERLGESDREVIELRHHGGMSFAQMAEMLGEPLGTLLARHHRALRKLKTMIDEDHTSDDDD